MKLVGKQRVDYISRKTNQQVTGVTLHCIYDNERVEGTAVETLFVSSKSPMYKQVMTYPLNSDIMVSYNRWGSVDSVALCKKN